MKKSELNGCAYDFYVDYRVLILIILSISINIWWKKHDIK